MSLECECEFFVGGGGGGLGLGLGFHGGYIGLEDDGEREEGVFVVEFVGKRLESLLLLVWVQGPAEALAPDEFHECGAFAECFDFFGVNGIGSSKTVLQLSDVRGYFVQVLACFGLVDVLKMDVVYGLGFHVRKGAGKRYGFVGGVEGRYGVGDDPEVG